MRRKIFGIALLAGAFASLVFLTGLGRLAGDHEAVAASVPGLVPLAAPSSAPPPAKTAPASAPAVEPAANGGPDAVTGADPGPGRKKSEYPKFNPIELSLESGERLTYQIKWGAVDGGQAVLTVKRRETFGGKNGPEVWNIQCETRSNAFVSMFYEVNDKIKTLIDAREGCTRLFDMDKNEGSFHGAEHIDFDYDKLQALYTKTNKEEADKIKRRTIALPGKVHDPLSCLYYIRGLELAAGDEHELTVNTSKKNWVMLLKVLRAEDFSSALFKKDVKALVVEPEAQFEGIFVRKGKMTVWLEERTRVPLMMKVQVPIGSVTAVLVKAENSPLEKLPGRKK